MDDAWVYGRLEGASLFKVYTNHYCIVQKKQSFNYHVQIKYIVISYERWIEGATCSLNTKLLSSYYDLVSTSTYHCIDAAVSHLNISRRFKHLLTFAPTTLPLTQKPGSEGTCCDTGLPKFVDPIHGLGSTQRWFFKGESRIGSTEIIVALLLISPGVRPKEALNMETKVRDSVAST